ncbi:stress responsive a/B barrel domain-containing protein [Hirsutella rhossiliensis]|uniref:Stress responsive a/B barrel domain-containing protein n=1 Tax=Hirsutella rhossiliensis TaxID=111463 RepID=A0A9P8MXV1_9HYPO|nr:stress responsive a/B barrel domain-containing protein [Hirsutella rhossiliensis]KAH0963189.1 stress responsive a/B barrel domain-containing protein [Hirsutella rhossiliensis]
MGVHHIVMFQFKADASPEAVKGACDEMVGLAKACVHPATTKPYIKSVTGGKDISIEGMQNGMTHAFVVEFQSVADRDFYVKEDAAHRAFVEKYVAASGAVVAKALVVDFAPGEL